MYFVFFFYTHAYTYNIIYTYIRTINDSVYEYRVPMRIIIIKSMYNNYVNNSLITNNSTL